MNIQHETPDLIFIRAHFGFCILQCGPEKAFCVSAPWRNDSSKETVLVNEGHCWCLLLLFTPVGSRACSSPSLGPDPPCHGGVKTPCTSCQYQPTCVCVIPAVWRQPSKCSGLGEPGICSALSGGRGNGPAAMTYFQLYW